MDQSRRQITKIAREVTKFTVREMKAEGIGTAEFDFIHLVRHHPGITQTQIRDALKIDKGAAARRAASLEAKGYLVRRENPNDHRSQLLYATEKAEGLRNSKAAIEQTFYEWLLDELSESDRDSFCHVLNDLYLRSKKEARAGFPEVSARLETGAGRMNDRRDPQRITWYFAQEKSTLAVVTVSGLLYNAGLLAGPLFEGRLVGTLLDVLNGTQTAECMALLALAYLATIAAVQGVRCIKRLYVRRFANDINRRMKHMLMQILCTARKKNWTGKEAARC